MVKNSEFSPEEKQQIVMMRQEGISRYHVSVRMNCSERTVSRICAQFRETGETAKPPRSGQPRKSTARDDRQLVHLSRENRFQPAKVLNRLWNDQLGIQTSVITLRRQLI